jgi:hypothetical protein
MASSREGLVNDDLSVLKTDAPLQSNAGLAPELRRYSESTRKELRKCNEASRRSRSRGRDCPADFATRSRSNIGLESSYIFCGKLAEG